MKLSYAKPYIKRLMRSSPLLNPVLQAYMKYKYAISYWKHSMGETKRFQQILEREKINVVLDVGAHAGETGMGLRNLGYRHRIISFEPIREIFERLQKRAAFEPPWECYPFALGSVAAERKFNVLVNAPGSSFLECHEILREEYEGYGGLQKTREEKIEIRRLDELYPALCKPSDSVLLKIDTQGFEREVLEGAGEYLTQIKLLKLEVSLVPLYENETLIADMIHYLQKKNFVPISIESGHISKKTLHQLQADLIFYNQNHQSG